MENSRTETDSADTQWSNYSVSGEVNITTIEVDFEGLYQEWLNNQHKRTDLRIETIQCPERFFVNHVERSEISPEITVPVNYAQWTDRRSAKQILKGDEISKRKTWQDRDRL